MGFGAWMNSKIRKCSWVDMQFVKLSAFAFALMLAKLWEPLLSLDWYWYAAIGALAAIKPLLRLFEK